MAEPTDRPGKSADELLAYLVPDRECGSCVACCKILDITDPELKKPAGELCPHCTGSSCGIYEQRPQACRSWYCLWRRIEEMPDEARPDRSGVVFSFEAENPPSHPLTRFYVVGRLINGLEGLNDPGAQAALNMFTKRGRCQCASAQPAPTG